MGFYLNSKKPYLMFQESRFARYFVDKSKLIEELIPVVEWPGQAAAEDDGMVGKDIKYICITRPRRFGKTMAANMVTSYFGKGYDSSAAFQGLLASSFGWFGKHLNKHNVIHIMFNELPDECTSYAQYISRIKKRLLGDLIRAFPDVPIEKGDALWDAFNTIIEFGSCEKFIFVLDEWDFIFHRDFVTAGDKAAYLDFLSSLLKDQPYVELAYMTGILPIAKYASGSELNMFCEYTMATEEKYANYFGFTEAEVDGLYEKYLKQANEAAKVTREGLRLWYDGYHTKSGKRVYNPRSVVLALTNNNLGNYWTSSGPYDEIFSYNEAELTMVVNMAYLSARDSYRIEREDKAGIGFVDFIFYPLKMDDDCIILELKSGHTAEEALQQIKDRCYALKFQGKLGERPQYTGRILAVGIAYDKRKTKRHSCRIEILRNNKA